jgi:hypothetical protein
VLSYNARFEEVPVLTTNTCGGIKAACAVLCTEYCEEEGPPEYKP